jgi:hypothetical protein
MDAQAKKVPTEQLPLPLEVYLNIPMIGKVFVYVLGSGNKSPCLFPFYSRPELFSLYLYCGLT